MHILNNTNIACVFPTRCGTRWISSYLHNYGFLDYSAPNHSFDSSLADNKTIIMFVRNPFIRERSIFRWQHAIKNIPEGTTFDDYINNYINIEPSFANNYGIDNIKLVDMFVDVNNATNKLKELLNIQIPEYDNSYRDDVDDFDDIQIYKDNPHYIERVKNKYKQDIKLINLDLTL